MFFSQWRERRRLRNALLEGVLREAEVIDVNEPGWDILSAPGDYKRLDSFHAAALRKQAVKLYYRNPHARSAIRNLVKFIIGQGIQVEFQRLTAESEERGRYEAAWWAFVRLNGYELRQKEIVMRTLRDGECFLRFYAAEMISVRHVDNDGNPHEYDLRVPRVRFLEPDDIKRDASPAAGASDRFEDGIELDPEDAETPIAYWWEPEGREAERIPASEIEHIKVGVDTGVKRGRSVLEPVLKLMVGYEEWLNDRRVLNKVRNRIALIKYVESKGGGATVVRDTNKLADGDSATGLDKKQRMLQPGTVVTANKGIKYEFLSPNINASDVSDDGRRMLLAEAAGMGLPEYMISADASNANYASTMVAESPGVREFEDWQDFFREHFKNTARRVIAANDTPAEIEDPALDATREPEIVFPPLIARNLYDETRAYAMLHGARVLSGRTWAAEAGFDYDGEQMNLAQEDRGLDAHGIPGLDDEDEAPPSGQEKPATA